VWLCPAMKQLDSYLCQQWVRSHSRVSVAAHAVAIRVVGGGCLLKGRGRACCAGRGRPQTVKQTSQVASVVIRDTAFGSMGAVEPPAWMSAAARRWLENAGATAEDTPGRAFNALPLSGVRVSLAERGRALCSLRVPPHLTVRASPSLLPPSPALAETKGRVTGSWLGSPAPGQDAEGNWHAGAIAAAADDVCAAAIMSVEGIIKVSVHYDISYFTPAKLHVRTHDTALLSSFSHKSASLTLE
jgi:hypothetical protein